MRLESLHVYKTIPTEETIRYIKFNASGLNLIVDQTSDVPQESGNSVGKSTVINIIDICLNAKSVNVLYKSKDGDGENLDIKQLLENGKVYATLSLTDGKTTHHFTRSLFSRGKRLYNNEVKKAEEYEDNLKLVLFNSGLPKPTFRQLISKFVRTDETQLNNVLKYLIATSNEVYEAIYFFLLRIDSEETVNLRQQYDEERRKLNVKLEYYKADPNIPSLDFINQSLELMDKEIQTLLRKRESLDYMDAYREEFNKQSDVNLQMDSLASDLELLRFNESTIIKSLKSIEESKFDIDLNILKEIYQDAERFNEDFSKEFEEVVEFHNRMIENRYDFINKQLINTQEEIKKLLHERDILLEERRSVSINLLDEGLLHELDQINKNIDELNVQKGEFLKAQTLIESLNLDIEKIDKKISGLEIESEKPKHLAPLAAFNEVFSNFSEVLYKEKYLLVYNTDWRNEKKGKPFTIGNLKGNLGIGKQRALSIAFDLAYVKFAKQRGIISPEFVIYDQMENTHINQLSTIFDLAQKQDAQLIMPILKERLHGIDEGFLEKSTIVELSSINKFFRV